MKRFKLTVDQSGLNLIVRHLNKGVYDEVAQLLSDLHAQVQEQLPKPKLPKPAMPVGKPHTNGNARYAKAVQT